MKAKYIENLISEIYSAQKEGKNKIPGNAFFIGEDKVVCCERKIGESRFPYSTDGLVVWLRTTGFIDANESKFTVFRTANFGEESPVQFFGGIKKDGTYTPVSITGAGRHLDEDNIKRYIVYSMKSAVCIVECEEAFFAMRLYVDKNKKIHFSLLAKNRTDKKIELYISSFIEAILRYAEAETFWQRMSKFGETFDGGFDLYSKNDYIDHLIINRKINGNTSKISTTVARNDFLGIKGSPVANALSLKYGYIEKTHKKITTTDLPCAADIVCFDLDANAEATVEYQLTVCHKGIGIDEAKNAVIDENALDIEIENAEAEKKADYDNLKISFEGWKNSSVDSDTYNKFLRFVQNQTSFCAHGNNYAGQYLGIRDVFQQLEGALIWQRELSREKILNAFNYILTTGRPPRMFAIPDSPDDPIPLDLEKYIDQGNWIISTVYTYLAYTDDYSILHEICDYLDAPDEPWVNGYKTGERTTVLEHLVRITDFLLSNIDTEYTGCLKVLFGDWNDAVDGLGTTKDENKEFGTGVTVMASLQFRKNLMEMSEILKKTGEYTEKIPTYEKALEGINEGLDKFAVDTDRRGNKRIVHGWGDKVSYKVGSFCDPDGEDRFSLTSNAFWAISGFIKRNPELKSSIMDCVDAVSSKYGLKTFDKAFPPDCEGVGRITKIVPGTYENSCAYAHGSLFGTMGLFAIGEPERAWREIEKTVVITHENATMTSFVMPNSYCENEEFCLDGESLGDWHTGSGCVLMKETVSCVFGIVPTLDGLKLQMPAYFPSKHAEISLKVKNTDVTVIYDDENRKDRTVEISGALFDSYFDDMMNTTVYYIPAEKLGDKITVKVCD